jgi:hypothetical protein
MRFIDGMLDAAASNDPERLTELDTALPRVHSYLRRSRSPHLRTWQGISPLNWTMMTVIRLK